MKCIKCGCFVSKTLLTCRKCGAPVLSQDNLTQTIENKTEIQTEVIEEQLNVKSATVSEFIFWKFVGACLLAIGSFLGKIILAVVVTAIIVGLILLAVALIFSPAFWIFLLFIVVLFSVLPSRR